MPEPMTPDRLAEIRRIAEWGDPAEEWDHETVLNLLAEVERLTAPPALIGPLTAEEWCSLRLGGLEDDPLYCCAVTSSMRDFLFEVLRMGAEHSDWSGAVREAFGELDVACEVKHPLIEKVRAYYFGEVPHA
jgi:hypothetical protein